MTTTARIIPARAGFTHTPPWTFESPSDHPRSRGVYGIRRTTPPGPGRIIPARAGFTPAPRRPIRAAGDHPRSRGVYAAARHCSTVRTGSSPLARGLHPGCEAFIGDMGIIPARAGFTPGAGRAVRGSRDHPRSRGVYAGCRRPGGGARGSSPLARGLRPATAATWTSMGSSPLARGLPLARLRQRVSYGIIPARAGFTTCTWMGCPRIPDHPRSRGVYGPRGAARLCRGGSSPLARGLQVEDPLGFRRRRIIPARAGFTPGWAVLCSSSPDHPRSRGVYEVDPYVTAEIAGSSPLARGLPKAAPRDDVDRRIIPARAGFTAGLQSAAQVPGDHPRSRGVYVR